MDAVLFHCVLGTLKKILHYKKKIIWNVFKVGNYSHLIYSIEVVKKKDMNSQRPHTFYVALIININTFQFWFIIGHKQNMNIQSYSSDSINWHSNLRVSWAMMIYTICAYSPLQVYFNTSTPACRQVTTSE